MTGLAAGCGFGLGDDGEDDDEISHFEDVAVVDGAAVPVVGAISAYIPLQTGHQALSWSRHSSCYQ